MIYLPIYLPLLSRCVWAIIGFCVCYGLLRLSAELDQRKRPSFIPWRQVACEDCQKYGYKYGYKDAKAGKLPFYPEVR